MFFDVSFSNSSEFHYLEPGLYPSIRDIVEAMDFLIQERHNHAENSITVKSSRRTRRDEVYLANEGTGFAFFVCFLGNIVGGSVDKALEMIEGKRTSQTKVC